MSGDLGSDSRTRLTQLWFESEGAVRAYVFSAVRGLQDAEDVVQQVALTAAKRFDEYDHQRPFVGWLLWLAKSRIIEHYRRQARQQKVFSDEILDQLAIVIERKRLDETSARQVALESCLEKLPERSRLMLAMRYSDEVSMDRIAEQFGVTAGSLRVTLCRLRDRLAECVENRLQVEAGG